MTDYETFGDYQASEHGRGGPGIAMLLVGLGVGALIALMLAPKTGKQMRKAVRRRYEDAREYIEDFAEDAAPKLRRAAKWADETREKVKPFAKVVRNR